MAQGANCARRPCLLHQGTEDAVKAHIPPATAAEERNESAARTAVVPKQKQGGGGGVEGQSPEKAADVLTEARECGEEEGPRSGR